MKKHFDTQFLLRLGPLFILAGLMLGYEPLMQYLNKNEVETANPFSQVQAAVKTEDTPPPAVTLAGKPSRIVITSQGIDLTVVEGVYDPNSKTWTLSKDKAHYALMTPAANNQGGNTFIYGHNRKEVFSKLSKVKTGDEATVYTENGHKFVYVFRSAYETSPNDDSLFRYQGPPILTLQTCSGLWYQNRYLLTFDLKEAV